MCTKYAAIKYFAFTIPRCIIPGNHKICKIRTFETTCSVIGLQQQGLVISKLLRQDIVKYKSLFPHVSAAIQLSNDTGKYPMKGDTIQYVYTDSQHNNPLCRVVPIAVENAQEEPLSQYDKEKYKEMILDAAETVLGFLGFDRTVYSSNIKKKKGRRKWYDEVREERTRDIQTEMSE